MYKSEIDKLQTEIAELQSKIECAEHGYKPLEHAKSLDLTETASLAHCDKHGEFTQYQRYMQAPLGGLRVQNKTQCPKCLKLALLAKQEELIALQAKATKHRVDTLKQQSGISPRFQGASFANYEQTAQNRKAWAICERYADKWLERKSAGGGLVLCGKPGTGKNHLACAIANAVIEQYQDSARITTALRIARKIKSTWSKEAELSENEVIGIYVDFDLLIIDEIGAQFGSEAEKIILFEIINERYEQMKPTILISNLTLEELPNYIGERVLDRMKEGKGAVVSFDWESYRK